MESERLRSKPSELWVFRCSEFFLLHLSLSLSRLLSSRALSGHAMWQGALWPSLLFSAALLAGRRQLVFISVSLLLPPLEGPRGSRRGSDSSPAGPAGLGPPGAPHSDATGPAERSRPGPWSSGCLPGLCALPYRSLQVSLSLYLFFFSAQVRDCWTPQASLVNCQDLVKLHPSHTHTHTHTHTHSCQHVHA